MPQGRLCLIKYWTPFYICTRLWITLPFLTSRGHSHIFKDFTNEAGWEFCFPWNWSWATLEMETSNSWKSLFQYNRPRKEKNIQYPRSELQDDFLIAEKVHYYLVPVLCCYVGGQVTPLLLSSVMGPCTSVTPCLIPAILSWLLFGEIFIFLLKFSHWGLLRHPQTPPWI